MEEQNSAMENKSHLGEKATYRGLLTKSFPSILMMIAVSVYSLFDGFFVSNYGGSTQFAAVNFVYPVIMLIGTIGFMMGSGGAALVAKKFGEGDIKRGNAYFFLCVLSCTVLGIVLSTITYIFLPQILLFMKADEAMLPYCIEYGRILCIGVTFFNLQNLFQNFFNVAENPRLGFIVTVGAGISNIAFDAIFVAGLGMGIVGAAIGTVIGQVLGGLLPLLYFCKRNKSPLLLRPGIFALRPILRMMGNGLSEFITNAAVSILTIFINALLMDYYGENGVSAYGVIAYLWLIFAATFIGFSMSVCPKISYQFGAKNKEELSSLLRKSLLLYLGFGVIEVILAESLAYPICYAYVGYDQALFDLTIYAFRIYGLSYLFLGISMFGSAFFTALNNALVSCLISVGRLFVIELLLLELLPLGLGGDGIWISFVISQPIETIVVLILMAAFSNKYGYSLIHRKKKDGEEGQEA
ncbi:MAG: MATE family efflux transporter [Bacilli bacterium]|nr:MATE family efflux transporter [Bacilli bacterium]